MGSEMCIRDRHSTAIVPVTAAPNITPTKNDFKGDIFDLGNKLLRWFDVSGFGVLLLMAQLLLSQGLISGPLSRVLEDSGDN